MKITLVLMVRDEEKTIADTLRSWLPIADNVVVVDTGSEDETKRLAAQEILTWVGTWGQRNARAQEHVWQDFATNRNMALDYAAREFPDTWLVMVDADTRLHGAHALRSWLQACEPTEEAFDTFQLRTLCGNLSYPMHRIVRAGANNLAEWHFTGAVHEVLIHGHHCEPGPVISNCYQEYVGTDRGEKRAQWQKHLRTLLDGEDAFSRSPRTIHYIAQTHACLGNEYDAAQWYDLRWCRKDGYEPERWRAGLCLARLQCRDERVSPMPLFRELARLRPWRAEPWYELAHRYFEHCGDMQKALAYATMAASLPEPEHDHYMIEVDVYAYKARMLQALCYEELGMKGHAVHAYQQCPVTGPGASTGDMLYVKQRLAVLTNGG